MIFPARGIEFTRPSQRRTLPATSSFLMSKRRGYLGKPD
jgi:hypothetical protein